MAGAPRIIFANPEVEPLHENGFEGMGLGERAGIETAEQAVRAVMMAQARGFGQLPPEERSSMSQLGSVQPGPLRSGGGGWRGATASGGAEGRERVAGSGGGADPAAVGGLRSNPFVQQDRQQQKQQDQQRRSSAQQEGREGQGGEARGTGRGSSNLQVEAGEEEAVEMTPRQSFAMWAAQEKQAAPAESRRMASDAWREAQRGKEAAARESRVAQAQAQLQAEREHEAAALRDFESRPVRQRASQEESRLSSAARQREEAEARARAGEARRQAEQAQQHAAEAALKAPAATAAGNAAGGVTAGSYLFPSIARWFG